MSSVMITLVVAAAGVIKRVDAVLNDVSEETISVDHARRAQGIAIDLDMLVFLGRV
jgi:hypothetical protein